MSERRCDLMKDYRIRIEKTHSMIVTVEAENTVQAREIVLRNWINGEYILEDDPLQGVVITVPIRLERGR
jgi:hypothetical protein